MNINGKQFMNLQEAVAWLLQNNALPFQCSANYVADTEIAKTTIVNPSPAEVKAGAIVYFADGNIATVTGITSNGFMVGQDHIDLGLDVIGAIDGADITPNSVSANSISADQIQQSPVAPANLGALTFQNLAPRAFAFPNPTAQIFENITDSHGRNRFVEGNGSPISLAGINITYCRWSLSGSHLMMVVAGTLNNNTTLASGTVLARFTLPAWIVSKIYPVQQNLIEYSEISVVTVNFGTSTMNIYCDKSDNDVIVVTNNTFTSDLNDNSSFRFELDLLIDNAN